jgi:flagellar hook assembly protein FlgD
VRRPATSGAIAIGLLLVLSVTTFAATRALRAQDDIVNTVVLSRKLPPERPARISFVLARADGRADVLILTRGGAPVRTLVRGAELEQGPHTFRWDGTRDDGAPARPGRYRLRVVLGEQDRVIEPPGSIRVRDRGK